MVLIFTFIVLTQFPKEINPISIVINTGITIHQKIFASSQGDVCNYSPSCSHFAKRAMAKYGPLWGSLMAADRLMRCNPGAYQYFDTYYSGIKDHKIYDPVENNFIFGKIKKPKDTTSNDQNE